MASLCGGGEPVSFYAKEPDLAAAFEQRYPQAKSARSEQEILEDHLIQMIVSASILDEPAPLGTEVMRQSKDFMAGRPSITLLEQLAEVRRVQQSTHGSTRSCTANSWIIVRQSKPGGDVILG